MAQSQQPPDPGQVPKQSPNNRPWGCLLLMLLLMTICFFVAAIWFWNSFGIPQADKPTQLAAIAIIIAVFAVLVGAVLNFGQIVVGYFQWRSVKIEAIDQWLESIFQRSTDKIVHIMHKFNPFSHRKHFCVSYHYSDRLWAEWIDWQLDHNGHSTTLQEWGGHDLLKEKHNAERKAKYTLTLLSPNYLGMLKNEWLHPFKLWNLHGKKGIPVLVHECKLEGHLEKLSPIDLIDVDQEMVCRRLLQDLPLKPDLNHKSSSKAALAVVGHEIEALKPDLNHKSSSKEEPAFPGVFPLIWEVPYRQNAYFTGRDVYLRDLHCSFFARKSSDSVKLQAITGLSGIGKTQTALEYAHRYRRYYKTILWINASSQTTLEASCKDIHRLLKEQIAEEKKDDQNSISIVKSWLNNNTDWLLVLDQCNDLKVAENFIPLEVKGRILLTTRGKTVPGWITSVELCGLEPDEGALFLLYRIGLINSKVSIDEALKADSAKAKEISQAMGGLPLGIEHAGAYIEGKSSLSEYLDIYKTRRADLFRKHHQPETFEFKTIATTWSLSFDELRKVNQAASQLLQFCAFLGPAPIPEEIITQAPVLGPTLRRIATDSMAFNNAIEALREISFIERDPKTKVLIVHPLVQDVIKEGIYDDGVDSVMQRLCAERAVLAVNHAFPDVEFANWKRCQDYLPHAQACAGLIKKWDIKLPEGIDLLDRAACYLQSQVRYAKAAELYEQLLVCREKLLGPTHLDVATSLNNLAEVYRSQGRYKEAEPLYERAKMLRENNLGLEHPDVAVILNNMGRLNFEWGTYGKAPDEFYEKVEQLYEQALNIRKSHYGLNHPEVAIILNNMAGVYSRQKKHAEAKKFSLLALQICEQKLGNEHLDTAQCGATLASFYANRGEYEVVAQGRETKVLGDIVHITERKVNVEEYYQEVLRISRKFLVPNHPQIARRFQSLAELYHKQKKYDLAEEYFLKALAISNQASWSGHPQVADTKKKYAALLRDMRKDREAQRLERKAEEILEKHIGANTLK